MTDLSFEMKQEFLNEASILLVKWKDALKELQNLSVTRERLLELFSITHSLKGICWSASFNETADHAHKVESILQSLLNSTLEFTPEVLLKLNHATSIFHQNISHYICKVQDLNLEGLILKCHQIVIETAEQTNKLVRLKVTGEDTEVDPYLLASLTIPLMHLLRNSIDHGILKNGRIDLDFKMVESIIIITLKDDGHGMELKKIFSNARKMGLIAKDIPMDDLDEKEILNLTFLPGLTTKENVTSVSGRGMGLDIVKSIIEGLNGSITLNSKSGQGTCFTLSLPLLNEEGQQIA